MNITESKLKSLIEEEIADMMERGEIDEGFLDRMKARGSGAIQRAKGGAQSALQRGAGAAAGAVGFGALGKKMKTADDTTSQLSKTSQTQSKLKSIVGSFQKDLTALGLADDPLVAKAVRDVVGAISQAMAKVAAEKEAALGNVGGGEEAAPQAQMAAEGRRRTRTKKRK